MCAKAEQADVSVGPALEPAGRPVEDKEESVKGTGGEEKGRKLVAVEERTEEMKSWSVCSAFASFVDVEVERRGVMVGRTRIARARRSSNTIWCFNKC